jgi:glyoxylase-like metal-dependent hydrolase (beta-lactamase superfamily II)/rhodanese-related sulfurtransferase
MLIHTVRTEGLGDNTYVLTHEGVGVVVDPQRDFDRFEAVLNDSGADLRFVLETHLHNDYISGGRDLAGKTGGELVLPAGAAPVFRHRPAFHNEDLEGGSLVVRPIHTPGHTPEHTSYLVLIDDRPVAVFSGGSLLVGSAGRPDLLGLDRADSLARLQYSSVHRLARLPDEVGLYPTHGAGSFCTASGAGSVTSTIGEEKKTNPVLAYPDEESFVTGQLSGLVPYPSYYAHMGPANVNGVAPIAGYDIPTLGESGYSLLATDVQLIDARPKKDFAAGHLPGSLAIELRNDFGVWAGWVLPFNAPLVLILNPDQDLEEALRQLARIGFDDVRGVVRDLDSWSTDLESYRLATPDDFAAALNEGAQMLDTRAPNEWATGYVEASTRCYAPDVVSGTPESLDPDRPVWVACETGYRASIAASALQSRGFEPVVLAGAGVTEVLRALSN